MKKNIMGGLLAAAFVSPLSFAAAQEVDEIIVSATGIPTSAAETGASVDVITAADLEAQQIIYLQDALKLKGINVPQSGGVGTLSNVFLRGLPGKYTTLNVDGISMFDAGSNQVLWNDVISDGVGQVEILRGSQGVIYGSNTIAGVISQFSAIGGETENNARLEVGEMGTQRLTLFGQGANGRSDYGYAISQFSSDSISASSNPSVGSAALEDDAYENVTVNARARSHLSDVVSIDLVIRQASGELDKDGFSSDAAGISEKFKRTSLRLAMNADFGAWQHRLGVTDYDATIEDFSGGSKTGERLSARQTLDYRGLYQMSEAVEIILGAEQTQTEFENTDTGFSTFAKADVDLLGLYGLVQWQAAEALNVTVALREDDHNLFGAQSTYRATAAYQINPDMVWRAAFGTGFRAPSLSELYLAFYGNADLQPETSVSAEVGFDTNITDDMAISATVFTIKVENIIGYDENFVNRQVSGTSEINGVEIAADFSPMQKLHLSFDAAYTDSKKPVASGSGATQREVRVPRIQIGLAMNYVANDRLNVGASLRAVRDTLDIGNVELDDYTLIDLRANYALNDKTAAYVRLENAADEDYEVINGFSTPGRAAYIGVTTKF